jgi:hypothetical protein
MLITLECSATPRMPMPGCSSVLSKGSDDWNTRGR